MKNMKVRAKMLTGFIIVTVIGLLLGVVGLVAIQRIKSDSNKAALLQTENNGVSGALNAHYMWRHNLVSAVLIGGEFTGSLDPNTCALGEWLSSDAAKGITDPVVLDLLQKVGSPHSFIHNEAKTTIGYIQAGELEEAKAHLVEAILPKTQEVITLLTEVQNRFDTLLQEKRQETLDLGSLVNTVLIVLIVVAAVISILMALYISNLINKPLIPLTAFFRKAGMTGDITLQQVDIDTISKYSDQKDEFGQLINSASSFIEHISNISKNLEMIADNNLSTDVALLSDNDTIGLSMEKMLSNFNSIFAEINSSSNQVAVASKQVADGAQSLAQGATEQAASIEELSSSITEIAEMTKESAAIADISSKLSATIKDNAKKGSRKMDEMIMAVGEINEASKNISRIIKTIDDIAFQTNILALNAAVEAARAGQHGKGFAVVAEEVRNLASKSAQAAKDTGGMIQDSMEKAELGSQIAGETAASLSEIVTGINESSRLIAEIASASEQQSLGISQINIGIDQVTQVVQQNSATAEESAAASEEMSGQSAVLRQSIAQFKLKESSGIYRGLPSERKRLAMPVKRGYALSDSGGDFGKY